MCFNFFRSILRIHATSNVELNSPNRSAYICPCEIISPKLQTQHTNMSCCSLSWNSCSRGEADGAVIVRTFSILSRLFHAIRHKFESCARAQRDGVIVAFYGFSMKIRTLTLLCAIARLYKDDLYRVIFLFSLRKKRNNKNVFFR